MGKLQVTLLSEKMGKGKEYMERKLEIKELVV